jgi:hypothetical protein
MTSSRFNRKGILIAGAADTEGKAFFDIKFARTDTIDASPCGEVDSYLNLEPERFGFV